MPDEELRHPVADKIHEEFVHYGNPCEPPQLCELDREYRAADAVLGWLRSLPVEELLRLADVSSKSVEERAEAAGFEETVWELPPAETLWVARSTGEEGSE